MEEYWRSLLSACTLQHKGMLMMVCLPKFLSYADPQFKGAWNANYAIIAVPVYERWDFVIPQDGELDDSIKGLTIARMSLHHLSVVQEVEGAGTNYDLFCNLYGKKLSLKWPTLLDGTSFERTQYRRLAVQYAPKVGEAIFVLDDDHDIEEDASETVRINKGFDRESFEAVFLSHVLSAFPV